MPVLSKKQDLKDSIIDTIQKNKDIINLYRELLVFNNKIKIYLSQDAYDTYINELYNIIDTYLYSDTNSNIKNISISINKIYIIINAM
jgi:hypothetical protein